MSKGRGLIGFSLLIFYVGVKKTSLYFLLIRRYLFSRHKHRVRLECSGFLSVMSQSINQSGRIGSDRVGSGRVGSGRVGSGRVGSGLAICSG